MDEHSEEIQGQIDAFESILYSLNDLKAVPGFDSIEWDLRIRDMAAPIVKQITELKSKLEN